MRFPAIAVAALVSTHLSKHSSADNVELTLKKTDDRGSRNDGGNRRESILVWKGDSAQQLDQRQQSLRSLHDSSDALSRTRPLRYREHVGSKKMDRNEEREGAQRNLLVSKKDTHRSQVSAHQECDPNLLLDDADLGILSCGDGQYCVESSDSIEGGICVTFTSGRLMPGRSLQVDTTGGNSTNSTNSTNITDVSFFDEKFDSFCVSGDAAYDICACTNIDGVSSTVDIYCIVWDGCIDVESQCGSYTGHCFTQEYNLNFTAEGGYFDRAFCYVDTQPFSQSLCFVGAGVNGTINECSVLLDGTQCQSCVMAEMFYNEDSCVEGDIGCIPKSFFCYEFDCTNVPGGLAGVDCGDGSADPLFQYLRGAGCIDECNICGSGSIINNPNAVVNFSDGQHECGVLPLTGFYTDEECVEIQLALAEVCCAIFEDPPTLMPSTGTESSSSSSPPAQSPSPLIPVDDGNVSIPSIPSAVDPITTAAPAEGGTTPTTTTTTMTMTPIPEESSAEQPSGTLSSSIRVGHLVSTILLMVIGGTFFTLVGTA
jgi:hypothetical protein